MASIASPKIDYRDSSKYTFSYSESRSSKVKEIREGEVIEDARKARFKYLAMHGTLLVLSVVCVCFSLATRALFTHLENQVNLSTEGDRYVRECNFNMGFNGMLIYIHYTEVETGAGPYLDVDRFLLFSEAQDWPESYGESLEAAARASVGFLACEISCALLLIGAAVVMAVCIYQRTSIRLPFRIGLGAVVAATLLSTVGVAYFFLQTQDLRAALESASDPVARDTAPAMQPALGFWFALALVPFSGLQLVSFWRLIPDSVLLENDEKIAVKNKERSGRIKQYMDDVTNDTYLREKYTVMPVPDPDSGEGPSSSRRPNLLPPLKGGSGADEPKEAKPTLIASKRFKKGCFKPLQTSIPELVLPAALPGAVTGELERPPSSLFSYDRPPSPMATQRQELVAAGQAQLMKTLSGDSLLLPEISSKAAALAPQAVPEISEDCVIEAFHFRQEVGIAVEGQLPLGTRPSTRQRPVSRAPKWEYHDGKRSKKAAPPTVTMT